MTNAYANRPTPGAPRTADVDYANAFADATNAVPSTTLITTTVPPPPTKVATSAPMCDSAVGIGALLTSGNADTAMGADAEVVLANTLAAQRRLHPAQLLPLTFHDSFN